MAITKQTILKWMLITLWIALGAGTVVLLVAAIRKKDAEHCNAVHINIRGVTNNFFVDKKDILNSITDIAGGNPVGRPVGSFELKTMEAALLKNIWLKAAELFFDNNETLQVNVIEREPVARVFTTTGATFYIDSTVTMLPLSEKFSARVPVFTNFPSDKTVLSKADSNLLSDIKTISMAIQKDSFRMAMIEQVDLTAQRTFEMIPKIGNQLIVFGDATDTEEKFNKLQMFYKEIMVNAGWKHYSIVNVQYKNQVVAKRRGAEDKTADSLRTLQLMQWLATNTERMASDSLQMIGPDNDPNSTDISMIQQSIQRDDNIDPTYTFEKPLPPRLPVGKQTIVYPKSVIPGTNEKPKPDPNIRPAAAKSNHVAIKRAPKTKSINIAKPKPIKPKLTQPKPLVEKPKNDY